jgi:hypothetical protein
VTDEELKSADERLRTINHELVCSHNDLLVALVRMEDLEREAREAWGAFERHVTTRCVNMADHVVNGTPMPCGECYSLENFWRPIPYEPESRQKGEYPGPVTPR